MSKDAIAAWLKARGASGNTDLILFALVAEVIELRQRLEALQCAASEPPQPPAEPPRPLSWPERLRRFVSVPA